MLQPLEWKKGDIVGYISTEKPRSLATDGELQHWLIAVTEFNREQTTRQRIEDELGLKPYLPVIHRQVSGGRRRKREIASPLFSSCIFVQMPLTSEAWDRVRAVRGIKDFMRIAGNRDKPATLPDIAIEEIRRAEAKLDAKYRRRLAVKAESPYRKGRLVWAEILPLRKMLGRIEERNAIGNIEVLLEVEVFGRKVWPVPPHLLEFIDA